MRTIVFTTHKGGCGKSTLAVCLAVAAQEAGERVVVLDMDPKKCAVRWGAKRKDRNLPVRAVRYAALPAALHGLAKRDVNLVVIDTPALESKPSLAAIKAADLSLVPARPATLDIWASEMTGRRLSLMNKDFVFLLNQCPPAGGGARVDESIATLEAVGTLLRPHIAAADDFLNAVATGKGATEIAPRGEAARDLRCLWLAIKRWPRRIPAAG
jgi:chromosome partitioning protein